jgi:ElaB/YqjD/DUF883 family membrane-anchored ribosome-binding protein
MSNSDHRNGPSMMADLNQRIDTQAQAAGQALDGLAHDAADFAQRSSDALQQRADLLRRQAIQARDATQLYIQHEPLKAVLYAAVAGAALMLIGKLLMRGPR